MRVGEKVIVKQSAFKGRFGTTIDIKVVSKSLVYLIRGEDNIRPKEFWVHVEEFEVDKSYYRNIKLNELGI